MSSSPAQLQLSPSRSPSLSSAFLRSPPRDMPATPPTASTCPPHAPPTPPDSSSRLALSVTTHSSPSSSSPDVSSDISLSAALSTPSSQYQSRLLDTPIDIHCLAPELDSPAVHQDSAVSVQCDRDSASAFKPQDQSSPSMLLHLRRVARDRTEVHLQRLLQMRCRASSLEMRYPLPSFPPQLVLSLIKLRWTRAREGPHLRIRARPTCTLTVFLRTFRKKTYSQ